MNRILEHSNWPSQPDSLRVDDGDGAAIRRVRICYAAGVGSLIAWIFLFWGCLVLGNVALYNHALFATVGHIAALAFVAVCLACGVRAGDGVGRQATLVSCGAAALSMAAYAVFGGDMLACAASLLAGAASAVAGVLWIVRGAGASVRFSFLCVVDSTLVSAAVGMVCLAVGPWLGMTLCAVLPMVCGALAFAPAPDAPSQGRIAGSDVPRKRFPWPFLSALCACCITSALFVGLATNPYVFQSETVERWWLLFACLALGLLLLWSALSRNSDARVFFLAALVFLLVGLFLFSAGILGSIVLPLGMVMAAETCCVALCWSTACLLARRVSDRAAVIAVVGLLFGDGVLARGVGMLVNNYFTLSFTAVATVASALTAGFALFYAIAAPLQPHAGDTVPVGLDESDDRGGNFLDSFDFTPQEQRVAACILEGMKYREIAESLDLSERTVKFHAKHAFEKVGVTKRTDFEDRARSWK